MKGDPSMLFQKITSLLTTEIKWGRIALLALGAALVAMLVSGGTFSLLALTVYSVVGIFVERVAPKHPFVNAFFYGLLGVLFYVTLLVFQALGNGQTALTAADLLWLTLSALIVVLPQALIGTWIGRSIRKFSQVAAESRRAEEAQKKAGTADRRAAPAAGKKPGSGPPRKKG